MSSIAESTVAVERGLQAGRTLRQVAPLRLRKILKKCLAGILSVVALWSLATMALYEFAAERLGQAWIPWVGLLFVLLLWKTGYQLLYFFTYFYHIDDQNLIVRKGVLAQTEITLPFSKITDVYVQQDVLDVVFGLYDVHFSTPTESSGILAHIDGVNRAGAYALRDIVLKRVNLAALHRIVDKPTADPELRQSA